jgi:hypothetical protein
MVANVNDIDRRIAQEFFEQHNAEMMNWMGHDLHNALAEVLARVRHGNDLLEPNTASAKEIHSMAGHGSLWAQAPGAAGLFRHGKVYELGSHGDQREWLCVLEASGVILRARIVVTEREAMEYGHLPSFWAKKWRDAFASMTEEALRIEAGDDK